MAPSSRIGTSMLWSLIVVAGLVAAFALAVPDLSGSSTVPAGPPDAGTVESARESAVLVMASGCRVDSIGAGVVVAEGIVTNAHVVAGATDVTITTTEGEIHRAEIRSFDAERDLALLHVPGLDVPALSRGLPAGGTEAVALVRGDDAVDVVPVSITRTITIFISDIYGDGRYERSGVELTADISPGDSGGGLIDANGDLVGVVFSASRRTPDVAYAISAVELESFTATKAQSPVDPGECR